MTEIEKTEGEIKVLQAKLELLKEMEIHKSKTPVQKAFYRVYGYYPSLDTDAYGGSPWQRFITGYDAGYDAGYDDGMENNKNFEKSKEIVDKHFEPTPQTPEQVEQGLRDAMKQAKEDGVFDEPKTLYDIVRHRLGYSIDCCDEIVDAVEDWLPDVNYTDVLTGGSYERGWNAAIHTTKDKLR